jgi:quinol monooxygenase YgiN
MRAGASGARLGRVIVALGDVYAQVPQRAAAQEAMLEAQHAALEQDGCVAFVFAEALGEPGHFVVVQRWRDPAALREHYRSESFFRYEAAIQPLLVRESELRVHVVEDEITPVDDAGLDLHQDD